jgi:hypothetical protein
MIKHLLAGVAAIGLLSGVAFAQVYPPAPPPPPGTVVIPAPPPPPIPGSGTSTTTTTVAPNPVRDDRETTIHKEVDRRVTPSSKRTPITKGSPAARIPTRRRRPTETVEPRQHARPPRSRDSAGLRCTASSGIDVDQAGRQRA